MNYMSAIQTHPKSSQFSIFFIWYSGTPGGQVKLVFSNRDISLPHLCKSIFGVSSGCRCESHYIDTNGYETSYLTQSLEVLSKVISPVK